MSLPPISRRLLAALVPALALGGCQSAAPTSTGCVPTNGYDCANVVNNVMLPLLAQEHVTPKLAADTELCRRYWVDLAGTLPSWNDYEQHCAGASPAAIVDYLMAQPEYLKVNQRAWADLFRYANGWFYSYYKYIENLDNQVGMLYAGTLSYKDFAIAAVTSPAMITRWDGENRVEYNFLAFLGREALPEEREDLVGLFRIWTTQNWCAPDLGTCSGTYPYNSSALYVDPSQCEHFPSVDVVCGSAKYGVSVYLPYSSPVIVDNLTAADWKVLQAPGRIIASQPYFYEAAVDRMLSHYLGWWHGGYTVPGYEVPAVRQALVDYFNSVAGAGDVRAVEREILTSVLYTMPAAQPPGDSKYWHYGPTKAITAEAWLDSLSKFSGIFLGSYDWRYQNQNDQELPGLPAPTNQPAAIADFDYRATCHLMGGCPDEIGRLRGNVSGVVAIIGMRQGLDTVCTSTGPSPQFLPPPGTTATALLTDMYRDILTIDLGGMAPMIAKGIPGGDSGTAVQLCRGLWREARALYY